MANPWQLALLKRSITGWNKWREILPKARVDLSGVDLRGFKFRTEVRVWKEDHWEGVWIKPDLSGIDLSKAILSEADFFEVDLHKANLAGTQFRSANLAHANLSKTNMSGADLTYAALRKTDLSGATLDDAVLRWADLRFANLCDARLRGADILEANFISAYSEKTDFSRARAYFTIFGNLGLGTAVGLENVIHGNYSVVTSDALLNARGQIPNVFLKGCGLSDWEIEQTKIYNPKSSNDEISQVLYRMYDLRATQALQISPLFISYSRVDGEFVDKLEDQLNKKGIRFWRDTHDMKSGRMEKQIDRAIRQNPTVLLVLSEYSVSSDWVEHEVRTARELEKEMGRDVLCPVALDDSWKSSRWPKRVMEQITEYSILDFSEWRDDDRFESIFRKLIDGLELFYKG